MFKDIKLFNNNTINQYALKIKITDYLFDF